MDIDLTKGLVAALVTIVLGLLGWRGVTKVGTDNARDKRESRFEDNLQKRLEVAEAKNSELRHVIDDLRSQLREAETRLTIMQMVASGDGARAVQFAQDSGFVDLSKPLRARPQNKPEASPYDVFQAADPYGPKTKK